MPKEPYSIKLVIEQCLITAQKTTLGEELGTPFEVVLCDSNFFTLSIITIILSQSIVYHNSKLNLNDRCTLHNNYATPVIMGS